MDRKSLTNLIESEKDRIEKLPTNEREKATNDLRDWIQSYHIAKQLGYGKGVLEKILNAKNYTQVLNIMIEARRAF